jgi:hypothetical protein
MLEFSPCVKERTTDEEEPVYAHHGGIMIEIENLWGGWHAPSLS